MMPAKKTLSSKMVHLSGIFYRRKLWFLVPFISGVALSCGILLLLTQFYSSPFFPTRLKQWLETENRQTILSSIEASRKELDQKKTAIHQFEAIHKNELASRLKIYLRILGQLHVNLYDVKRNLNAQDSQNKVKQQKAERTMEAWLNKKSILEALRKRYSDKHPKIKALQKEMQVLSKEIASGQNMPEQTNLNALKEQEARLTEQVHLYEGRIARIPDNEIALAGMKTKYNQTQKAYHALLQQEPVYTPDPIQIGVRGILIGFALGVLLVILREKMDHSIHIASELEQILAIPVFATIFDARAIPLEETIRPSATWLPSAGGSVYSQKTLSLVKDK